MNNISEDSKLSLEVIKKCLFKAERFYDDRLIDDLAGIYMPFGKYKGKRLDHIPLGYLDETISVMPPTWLVRRVQEFIDHAMEHPLIFDDLPSQNKRTLWDAEQEMQAIQAE